MRSFFEEYGGVLFVAVLVIIVIRLFTLILTKSSDGSLQEDPNSFSGV